MRQVRVIGLVSMLLITLPSRSELSSLKVELLIDQCKVITLATVTDVSEMESQNGKYLVATARVVEILKGPPMQTVQFRASPGDNMDDASEATKGDSVLLYLEGPYQGNYAICAFGRGYMPLRELDGVPYATYWDEVILPKTAPVITGPEPSTGRTKAVPFSYLKKLIVQHLHGKAAA